MSQTRDIEQHIESLRRMHERVIHFTTVLDLENERSQTEFAVKLEKIDAFCKELEVVDELETRLKKATDRIEDYKSRMEIIRVKIKKEKERQVEHKRRTASKSIIIKLRL